MEVQVLCNGYKNCSDRCRHNVPHFHGSMGWADCDSECCTSKPYHCTPEALNQYNRKDKLEKIKKYDQRNGNV